VSSTRSKVKTKAISKVPEPPRVPAQRPGHEGGKRDRNRRQKIREVCDAALDLFLEDGIRAVTIDEIVARAGIGKGSFYHYFKDKEELVATMLAPFSTVFESALDTCEEKLRAASTPPELAAAFLELASTAGSVVSDEPKLTLLFLQESRGPAKGARRPARELADRITDRAIALSEVARHHGLLRNMDPRVGTLITFGAGERLIFEHLSRGNIGDPAAATAMLVNVVLDGFRPR
jgi:AcrR family transcriptional regulator